MQSESVQDNIVTLFNELLRKAFIEGGDSSAVGVGRAYDDNLAHPLFNSSAERHKGQAGDLEMLYAEGDADDGDAEEKAEDCVDCGDLPPAAENPDDVEDSCEAAGGAGVGHVAAERAQ